MNANANSEHTVNQNSGNTNSGDPFFSNYDQMKKFTGNNVDFTKTFSKDIIDVNENVPILDKIRHLSLSKEYSRFKDDFNIEEIVGRGGGGVVYKVKNKYDGMFYAIKKIKFNTKNFENAKKLIKEVMLLSRLHHHNIVRYYQAWIENWDEDEKFSSEDEMTVTNSRITISKNFDFGKTGKMSDYGKEVKGKKSNKEKAEEDKQNEIEELSMKRKRSYSFQNSVVLNSGLKKDSARYQKNKYEEDHNNNYNYDNIDYFFGNKAVNANSNNNSNLNVISEEFVDDLGADGEKYEQKIGCNIFSNINLYKTPSDSLNSRKSIQEISRKTRKYINPGMNILEESDENEDDNSKSLRNTVSKFPIDSRGRRNTRNVEEKERTIRNLDLSKGNSTYNDLCREQFSSRQSDKFHSGNIKYVESEQLSRPNQNQDYGAAMWDDSRTSIKEESRVSELAKENKVDNKDISDCQQDYGKAMWEYSRTSEKEEKDLNRTNEKNDHHELGIAIWDSTETIPNMQTTESEIKPQNDIAINIWNESINEDSRNALPEYSRREESAEHISIEPTSTYNKITSEVNVVSQQTAKTVESNGSTKSKGKEEGIPNLPMNNKDSMKQFIESANNEEENSFICFNNTPRLESKNRKSIVTNDSYNTISLRESEKIKQNSESNLELAVNLPLDSARKNDRGKFYKSLYIQMEFCEHNTVKEIVDNKIKVEDKNKWKIIIQMVEALIYIHSRRLIHRDLKPSNIFLDSNLHVKIGDFGLATPLKNSFRSRNVLSNSLKTEHIMMSDGNYLSCGIGTLHYASPEQEHQNTYDEKSDMYSLGIIIFEMFYSFGTFMEREIALKNIFQKNEFPPDIEKKVGSANTNVISIVRNLVKKNPKLRLSSKALINSPLIPSNFNQKIILDNFERIIKENNVLVPQLVAVLVNYTMSQLNHGHNTKKNFQSKEDSDPINKDKEASEENADKNSSAKSEEANINKRHSSNSNEKILRQIQADEDW
eukprot:CAMPEP_0170518272 /NCGR_PEP_ID=MMETSP0209-20121228/3994_1 /TAXON_ID=665100 ORGANISM="Litonotus pictus, Strain P1" /NCGR_SAMPLE_ID=MMETSP0209 /ASSEMBLY_ACC=CAM_ASM_000301 /LENGTH=993 /DNA_ID=CAMNT_0010803759 /DNA_START=613 /DNA_END=3591 /DNA_ORIENTATION=+